MKSIASRLVLLFLFLSVVLSACGPAPAQSWPNLGLGQDVVYATSGQLYAVRTSDGSLLWTYKTDGNGAFAPAVANGDLVMVADYNNVLHAVNAKDGTGKWKFSDAKARYIAAPLFVDKFILAPSTDHFLYKVDLAGKLVEKFEADTPLWSQPVFDGQTTIYQASLGHQIYALDLAHLQTPLWKVDLGGAIVSTPLLDEKGILYVGTLAKQVQAVDTKAKKILWTAAVDEGVWTTPVIKDGVIYVASKSGTVYALKADSGAEVWKTSANGNITGRGVLASNGVVFAAVSSDKNMGAGEDNAEVYMFDFAKGSKSQLWSAKALLYGDLVVNKNNQILVSMKNNDKLITALDFSGKEVWSLPLPK